MANWETFRVIDILNYIDEGKFVLPVIQRPLVWDEQKMELLFDTLLKGDSFGGIMVIEEEASTEPLFNYRSFSRDGNTMSSRETSVLGQKQYFVIDGQQRMQSFYIGLKGDMRGKDLYFDLFSEYNKSQFVFKFEKSEKSLPKEGLADDIKTIKKTLWISAKELLNKLITHGCNHKQVAKKVFTDNAISNEIEKDYIEENIFAFSNNILSSKTLGIAQVFIDKTIPKSENRQRMVELFKRLNDGGTRLSPFDLVASILKGFEWEMEGFLKEVLDSYEEIGLDQDNLIKLIFILQDNHAKEMGSIEESDATFAISNRVRIKSVLEALKNFLIESELFNYYKTGNRSFIPLFFIIYHLYHKDIKTEDLPTYFKNYDTGNEDFPNMKKWITHSLINGVFKSKGAGWIPYKTGVRKILECMKFHKNKSFPMEKLFEVYVKHPISFTQIYNTENLDSLDSQFVFYLMYDKKETVRANDIDHIMPKSILDIKGNDWDKINSIKNFQLIDYATNRGEKNGKPFKQWINNPLFVKDKESFVKKHLIPADEGIWDELEFDNFIEARATLILGKIEKYV